METRANYVTIGLFVLAVIAGAFFFVYWLHASRDGGQRAALDILFPGSVTGLAVGAPVYFNGIRVGDVSRLSFAGDGSTSVMARLSVDATVPLKKDITAELGFQGLTGIAYVSLLGGSQQAASLFADTNGAVPLITADRSAFEDLLEGARDILKKADVTLGTIEKVVAENGPAISSTIQNIDQFSQALAANSDAVKTLFSDVGRAANTIADLSDRLQTIVTHVEGLVGEVGAGQVQRVVDNFVAFSDSLGRAGEQVDAVMADVATGTQNLQRFIDGLNASLDGVNRVIGAVPADAVKRIVESLDKLSGGIAARAPDIDAFILSARGAAQNINEIAAGLAERRDDIDATVTNIRSLTDRLDQLATGLSPVVADAGRIIGAVNPTEVEAIVRNIQAVTARIAAKGGDIDQVIDDARAAAASARRFADDVAAHTTDVDAVVADTRQMMERLNAASARVSGVIDKVEAMVEGDGKGLVAEATAAARAIRIVAQNFEPQSRAIATGLGRFSTSGLSDLAATIEQARQTLITIQNAVQGIERDPSRVIFGGASQPVYKPQRR